MKHIKSLASNRAKPFITKVQICYRALYAVLLPVLLEIFVNVTLENCRKQYGSSSMISKLWFRAICIPIKSTCTRMGFTITITKINTCKILFSLCSLTMTHNLIIWDTIQCKKMQDKLLQYNFPWLNLQSGAGTMYYSGMYPQDKTHCKLEDSRTNVLF